MGTRRRIPARDANHRLEFGRSQAERELFLAGRRPTPVYEVLLQISLLRLGHEICQPISNFNRLFNSVKVRRDKVFPRRSSSQPRAQYLSLPLPAKKIQHHRRSQYRPERVRNSLPRDVWRGAVDRLEQRSSSGMDVSGGRQSQPASKLRSQVC